MVQYYIKSIIDNKIGSYTFSEEIAKKLGWIITKNESEIEVAYDNSLWLKGFAPQISIEEVKLQKEDEINQACEKNITSGFWYQHSSQEIELHFSFDAIDQTNFLATADIVKDKRAGLAPDWVPDVVEWKGWKNVPHTQLVNLVLTLDGFTELNYAAKLHQLTNQTKAGQLKNLVYEATTKEELEVIKWE